MQEDFVLTREGYTMLKAELDRLEAQEVERQANFVDANDDADSSHEEAAEFDARVELERTQERIAHLRLVLDNVALMDETDPATADAGERVTVYDFYKRQKLQFDLRGSEEVIAGMDGVSLDSPVGQALNGRRIGEVVTIGTPDSVVCYAIRAIEPIPSVETASD